MLMPKKVKYRKQQRGRMAGQGLARIRCVVRGLRVEGARAVLADRRQIEAARVAMTRFVKRGGKIWIRVFPDKPITKKPQETRMGKGKGAPEQWVAVIKPGRVLFEMEGISETDARRAMQLASAKLPIKNEVRHALRAGAGAMSKPSELRDLTLDDLRQREHELDDQLFRMRLQKAMGQLDVPTKIRTVRRERARVKTILREKNR